MFGVTHYDLPGILRWFTANIGVHHVHHLCSRIPYYHLPGALRDHPELRGVSRLTFLESFGCVRLVLWDEGRRRLISFREMRRHCVGDRDGGSGYRRPVHSGQTEGLQGQIAGVRTVSYAYRRHSSDLIVSTDALSVLSDLLAGIEPAAVITEWAAFWGPQPPRVVEIPDECENRTSSAHKRWLRFQLQRR
jgi:hypothetical protein